MLDVTFDVPSGYVAFGDDQRISSVNAAAEDMLEYPRGALLGRPVSVLLAPHTHVFFHAHLYPVLAITGEAHELYLSLQKRDGHELATVLSAVRRSTATGALCECSFLPMQRRRMFEAELIAAKQRAQLALQAEQAALDRLRAIQSRVALHDQLATLGMLAAGVAHEINNPLSYVVGNLELLTSELNQRPDLLPLQAMLADASHGIERIRDIVHSLRTLSRMEDASQRVPVDVSAVVDLAARVAGSQIRQRAEFDVQPVSSQLVVAGDAGRLEQVLLNLLINAAQALPEGRPHNVVTLRAYGANENAIIEVEDNGLGIPRELQARIFDPFFTTKPAGIGTGLGLSVCQSIVMALGGTISVRSAPNVGSCFLVSIPLLTAATSPR